MNEVQSIDRLQQKGTPREGRGGVGYIKSQGWGDPLEGTRRVGCV